MILSCSDNNNFSVGKELFGETSEGHQIHLFTIKNNNSMIAKIINYGAILQSLYVADSKGNIQDVVLGYDTLKEYENDESYFGATVGRFGNRIAKGRFELEGVKYQLGVNNGENHLHGGIEGFNKKVWDPEIITMNEIPSLKLTYVSGDGEEGFPGELKISILFSLTQNNELKIAYEANTTKPTILNPTHHSYFNLLGAGAGDILNHKMQINADAFTPVDEGLIPTGEIRDVSGTPMDFRTSFSIGDRIEEKDSQIIFGLGYDHNWVLNDWDGSLRKAVTLHEPESGRFMEVFTTEPGIQFYSGNFLDGTIRGKKEKFYTYRSALCLEAQHFPDSPNHPNFPPVILQPNKTFKKTTIYKFSAK